MRKFFKKLTSKKKERKKNNQRKRAYKLMFPVLGFFFNGRGLKLKTRGIPLSMRVTA